jgi:ATP-dependent exoDNAse (exonuclease V) alpha subunit
MNISTERIEMTDEFAHAFDLMENTEQNLYITGLAGTGKSTLLKYFTENTDKEVVVLAPTGVAAINVQGSTLHSFFQLPFGVVHEDDIKPVRNKQKLFEKLQTIIIDEISMVRADIMQAIDYSLRINTGHSDEPFGGVQVIAFGDLYQLPPVASGHELEYLRDAYHGIYFFNAPAFKLGGFRKIELTQIFRQKDNEFIRLLNSIREDCCKPMDLATLNERVGQIPPEDTPFITLASTNKIVDKINREALDRLEAREFTYKANVKGSFKEKDFPTQKKIELKRGAQIMMIKNDTDSRKRWVNGSLGTIVSLTDSTITVKLDTGVHTLKKEVWEVFDYAYNKDFGMIEKKSKGEFKQFPVKLAWAVTIHKSQGKTFDHVMIDLGWGAFAHGQTYVALSRCSQLEGIYLKKPIRSRDIIVDQAVIDYHQ